MHRILRIAVAAGLLVPGERLAPVSRDYESWNTMEILAYTVK